MKGLEQVVFRVPPPFHCDSVRGGSGQGVFVHYTALGQYLSPRIPLHPSLLSAHFLPTASFQITPQNTVKMSQFPSCMLLPSQSSEIDNDETGLGLLAFLKAFLKD